MTISHLARIGAALYILWGILHFGAAFQVWQLAETLPQDVIKGRMQQNAWHLGMIAALAIVVAILGNWHNEIRAFWANFALVGLTDIGFILFVFLPGYVPVFPGVVGPIVWVLALAFSTLAIARSSRT